MRGFRPLKAVYSYFFPEVRPYAQKIYLDELFLTRTLTKDLQLTASGFDPPLKLPWTGNGEIDLDAIHQPIIDRVVRAYKKLVPALGGFEYRYPTAGSSEGIFHLLAAIKAGKLLYETTCEPPISVLKGEYEGYGEYAKTLGMGMNFTEYTPEGALKCSPWGCYASGSRPRVWFISNPSAINGMIHGNSFINELCDRGHKVILDLAYVGMTKPYEFDVSHKNIIAVVMSLSKPYGVFRFRMGGFTFSRQPIESLFANKWFKDVPALLTALKLVESFPPGSLYERYADLQRLSVEHMRHHTGLPIIKSDVFLLARMRMRSYKSLLPKQKRVVYGFRRGDGFRFCLTPYFEEFERRGRI
jgi:hypothetical protein